MKRIIDLAWAAVTGSILIAAPVNLQAADAPIKDSQMTHQVHSAIVADDSLPYCAHRVTVQSKKGKVTLNGLVHTQRQKAHVEAKAKAIAGNANVSSKIVVKGTPPDVSNE
jgi:osmotically-inducible protein OsmY